MGQCFGPASDFANLALCVHEKERVIPMCVSIFHTQDWQPSQQSRLKPDHGENTKSLILHNSIS